MAVPVESLKNNDTGKTWKEEFSNIDKNIKGYDELLTKFKQYVSEQEYFGKFQEKQLDSYLKSLDNLYDHWDEINSKIKDLQKEMDSVGLSASEIQNIFNDISNTISTVGQRMSIMKAPVTQLAALAGNINRAYEIQDGFTEKAVRSDLRRIQTSRDLYDSVIKRYTGGSLELDAIEKARQSAKARLSLSESEITVLEKKLQAEGRLNEAERTRLKDLRDINREASSAVELLSDKNIEAADRLVKLAKFNVDNRKAVVKKTPGLQLASGVLGKFAGILGLSDLQGEIKDIKESTLQKAGAARREIYENKVEPIESKQSELNKQIEAKRRELEVLKGTSGAQAAFTDIRSTQNATGTKRVREARFLIEEVQRYKNIAATADPKSGIYEKATSYVNTIQAFRDLAKLEAQAQGNASKLVKAQGELDKVTKVATEGSLKAMVGAFKDAVGSGWMLAFVIGKALWNQFKAVDELGVKLQREIGTWEGGVAGANRELISSKDYLEQAYEISTKFHIDPARVFTPVELAKAAEFKNMSNLSAQEVANLAVRSKSVSQSVTAYNTSMKEGYNNILKNTTTAVSFGAVQKEIANTSEAISLSLGDNPKKIAEAAAAALSLGMSMKDIEGVAENLMNFESSIEHEMEAQLLTGKQMNLAKAREYALNNDIAGLSRELHNNGVDAVKFQSMTYIQQKSLAQALGMSREQLAGMVRQQILGMNISDEAKRKMLKMNEEDYRRMTTEQQWQKTKEKFLQTLVPLMKPILDIVTMLVGPLKWIAGVLGKIIGLVQPVINFVQSLFSKVQKFFADGDSTVKKVVGTVVSGGANMASSLLMFSLVLGTVKKSLGGIGTAFKVVRSTISTGFGVITSTFKGAIGAIKSVITAIKGIGTASKSAAAANKTLELSLDKVSSRKLERTLARDLRNTRRTTVSKPDLVQAVTGSSRKRSRPTVSKPDLVQTVTGSSRKRNRPTVPKLTSRVESAGASLNNKGKSLNKLGKNIKGFNSGGLLKGAAAMILVAGSLYILAKALQQFSGVGEKEAGIAAGGLVALTGAAYFAGKIAGQAILGAVAMSLVGASLIPLAYALKLMVGVDWKQLGILALGLAGFFAAMVGIGTLAAAVAVPLAAGVLAVTLMGAALLSFGAALKSISGVELDKTKLKNFKDTVLNIVATFRDVSKEDVDMKAVRKVKRLFKKVGQIAENLKSLTNVKLDSSFTTKLSEFFITLSEKFNSLDLKESGLNRAFRKLKKVSKKVGQIAENLKSLTNVKLDSSFAVNLQGFFESLGSSFSKTNIRDAETLDVSMSTLRKLKRRAKKVGQIAQSLGNVTRIQAGSISADDLKKYFQTMGDIDLSKVNIPRKVAKRLRVVSEALTTFAGNRISAGIDAITASLQRFSEAIENLNVEKFNKLSSGTIRQMAEAGVSAEREATKREKAETRVEKTNLDNVLNKMDVIIRTIESSRPDWDWLKFDHAAAKSLPEWQLHSN